MTKLLDAIDAKRSGRVLAPMKRVSAIYTAENDRNSWHIHAEEYWRWKYGVTLEVVLAGPESARDDLYERARTLLAREVYGEVFDLVRDALEIAWEETYRPKDDPLTKKLEEILNLCTGGRHD